MNTTRVKSNVRLTWPLLSRKEREKNIRRQEIFLAARELFVLKGYYSTTLEEIARHAEFGKGTIYNYFKSKEELFLGIINKLAAEMVELARSSIKNTAGGAREKFRAYAAANIAYLCENSDLYQVIMREIHRLDSVEHDSRFKVIKAGVKKVWAILAEPLAVEIKTGKIKKYDPIKLASLFDSMIRFYHFRRFRKKRTLKDSDIDEVVRMIIAVFFDGISGGKQNKRTKR
jgi:AcrR family transcriptional regulator